MKIIWNTELESNTIVLPLEFKSSNQTGKITFHFGANKKELDVTFSEELSDSVILPLNVDQNFMIPMELTYEVKLVNSNLYLGPVIGFLLCNKKGKLKGLLEDFDDYVHNYEGIKGVIFVFSSEGINTIDQTLSGYYFKPTDYSWEEAVLPYPSSMYRRTFIPDKLIKELSSVIGKENIFNSKYYHKWKLYDLLSNHKAIQGYLPETVKLTNEHDLVDMVKKHKSVFIKPIFGTYGNGIVKIEKTNEGYQYVNKLGKKYVLKSKKGIAHYVRNKFRKGHYIVQKDVGFAQNDIKIDFRAILQKNSQRKWECTAFIARYGLEGRIFTNDASKIEDGIEALKQMFHLSDDSQLQEKKQEITTICTTIGTILDQYGHYADLGIDLAIDSNMNIWILEINHMFHDHDMAAYLNDNFETYKRVLSTLLEYMKTISGC